MATTVDQLSAVTPADWVPGPKQGQWNYREYAALSNDRQRYEVVNGVLYIAPSPNTWHQEAVGEIFSYLRTYVTQAGLGKVYIAPYDVELAPDDVVQPDVVVVLKAHLEIVTDSHIVGVPDLVVEVASPSTSGHDRREKQDMYAATGVPEYWVVNAEACTVEILVLENARYVSRGIFRGKAVLPSQIVPGLPVHVEQFFPFE